METETEENLFNNSAFAEEGPGKMVGPLSVRPFSWPSWVVSLKSLIFLIYRFHRDKILSGVQQHALPEREQARPDSYVQL